MQLPTNQLRARKALGTGFPLAASSAHPHDGDVPLHDRRDRPGAGRVRGAAASVHAGVGGADAAHHAAPRLRGDMHGVACHFA